jgi:ribosomal protein S11
VRSSLRTKKMRKSPYSVEAMFPKILLYLKFYKIRSVDIFIKMKLRAHIFFLFKELKLYGIRIFRIFEMYGVPHNGVKARKIQRK